jgi:hypothetical protein
MAQAKVEHALLDPKWEWGKLEIDNTPHIFITLYHPAYGPITSIVPHRVASDMAQQLLLLTTPSVVPLRK